MCPPTEQTHVTLSLPPNLTKLGIEQVVTELMRQAQAAGVYKAAATLLVRACLEQFMEGGGLHGDRRLHIRRTRYGWRIRGELLWVLPQLDDSFLDLLPRLGRSQLECTVLVPPWSWQLARKCSSSGDSCMAWGSGSVYTGGTCPARRISCCRGCGRSSTCTAASGICTDAARGGSRQ